MSESKPMKTRLELARWSYPSRDLLIAYFDSHGQSQGAYTSLAEYGKTKKDQRSISGAEDTLFDLKKITHTSNRQEHAVGIRGNYNIDGMVTYAANRKSDGLIKEFRRLKVPGANEAYEARLRRENNAAQPAAVETEAKTPAPAPESSHIPEQLALFDEGQASDAAKAFAAKLQPRSRFPLRAGTGGQGSGGKNNAC